MSIIRYHDKRLKGRKTVQLLNFFILSILVFASRPRALVVNPLVPGAVRLRILFHEFSQLRKFSTEWKMLIIPSNDLCWRDLQKIYWVKKFHTDQNLRFAHDHLWLVYGHLQQINLQRACLYGPPNIRTLAATSCSRPLTAATCSGH